MDRVTAELLLSADAPVASGVSEARWPSKYALDFVRSHPDIVPKAAIDARRAWESEKGYTNLTPHSGRWTPEQASGLIGFWNMTLGDVQTMRELKEQLALAYLIEREIPLPVYGEPLYDEITAAIRLADLSPGRLEEV